MKTLLLSALLLMPLTAFADGLHYDRGSRCPDETCFEQQRQSWRVAIAQADGKYAHRVAKMLAKWTQNGFPETYIPKAYAKIDAQFHKEAMAAGTVWFYEVQGYSKENTKDIVNSIVLDAETQINIGIIGTWLDQSGL